MDNDIVIFWVVFFIALSGVVVGLARVRSVGAGWVVVSLAILLLAGFGQLGRQKACIYLAAALWLLLVLVPGLLGRSYHRHLLRQQYPAARRLARIVSWLHPADGWGEMPQIVHALDLAQRGQAPAALEILNRFQTAKSLTGLTAMVNLCRITHQWERLLAWHDRDSPQLERHPQLLVAFLRARGETGDLRGLVELYDRHKEQIAKLIPPASRDNCRLMLFAFCGRRDLAERLFAGSLAPLPAATREFWLATADLAAGSSESAKRQLELLLPAADAATRLAVERRLARLLTPASSLDAAAEAVIQSAALEHGHEESFGARPSLFSKQARAVQILIALNLLMFAAEMAFGGASNPDTLYRLGALNPLAVRAGEWWRLGTSLFLHFGPLHIAMNMLALWLLGPFVEFALGFRRFLLVYLLAGVGSMGMVMRLASGPAERQLTVGASGCIMGLVGATGALMLRGWLREKALSARKRLGAMFLIVAMQTVFDALVPQVSMTAHLSGALIGFAASLILRDRLISNAGTLRHS
ncbi:MAG: rhomboid family intramembrane serine protease [Verrucomicrobiota bacterium]